MGAFAEAAIEEAMRCLVERDSAAAEQLVEADVQLDELEAEAERRVVELIALRAPMADDLREAIAALKIAGVVERIGDYAKNIARRVRGCRTSGEIEPLVAAPGDGADGRRHGARRAHGLRRPRSRKSHRRVRRATMRSTISTRASSGRCSPT